MRWSKMLVFSVLLEENAPFRCQNPVIAELDFHEASLSVCGMTMPTAPAMRSVLQVEPQAVFPCPWILVNLVLFLTGNNFVLCCYFESRK